jgi:cytochrome c oxidase assembly factor CtaG
VGLTPLDFFTRARPEPLDLVVLALAGTWYLRARRRVEARGRSWPRSADAAFAGAWALVAVAACSGLYAFAPSNFSAYASLYVMVAMVAPALLALSAPLQLELLARPGRTLGLDRRVGRALTHPIVTYVVFAASLFVLFFTGLLRASLTDDWLRQGLYLVLVAVGYLHWLPVADVDPLPRRLGYWPRILYMLLVFPLYTVVGMALESQARPIAPATSLASLHLGAAVLWVTGETVALAGALGVFVQWLRAEARRAREHDLAHAEAAESQLALWRAARDAAARAGGSGP